MQAGNAHYRRAADLPETIPVFPLSEAILLPGGRMPLNIFEPRYLEMIDKALAGSRVIGMIQPRLDDSRLPNGEPEICEVGCAGRIVSLAETGDGRYLISLNGICRFRVIEELKVRTPYRQCRVVPFETDLHEDSAPVDIDRPALLRAFRAYLEANDLEADWDSVSRAENAILVNALSMMAPFGAAEKQALLEAADLKARAETLIAIAEIVLARGDDDFAHKLQ
ncbi:hypothetical protein L598_000200000300 [Mesorhizobium sp. J18]|uniref:LON peptidase substrate-binding domain-containing protein n=1 Tax=Mesorhizobium sp. J18 TaxID=935263 RepID=UPI00119A01B1|nr:LON peptidase substrate-binding domain-containing protein [Mesorhizobium sp. J18]TWG97891.1 hypothetical protein L598_000200000300 [Mesorhizobium sp. J18]